MTEEAGPPIPATAGHTQREELAALPGSCVPWLYRNLDTALLREPPLGGCVKEEQELGCTERARHVWTCPLTRDTEGDRQGRDSQSHRFAQRMDPRSSSGTLCLAQGLGAEGD